MAYQVTKDSIIGDILDYDKEARALAKSVLSL